MVEWKRQTSIPPMWKPRIGESVQGLIVGKNELPLGEVFLLKLDVASLITVQYVGTKEQVELKAVAGDVITLPGQTGINGALVTAKINGTLARIELIDTMPAKKGSGKNDMNIYNVDTADYVAPMQKTF
jgi:hypothetical protein